MYEKIRPGMTKCAFIFMSLLLFFMIFPVCFAETNTSKVDTLLQEIYAENPKNRDRGETIKEEIYNRLKIARERNYSDGVKSNGSILNSSSEKEVFEKIYNFNFWGNNESKSGPGSQMGSTEAVRESLPKLFEKYNIKSVLDTPCGDYNWMKSVNKSGIKYIGGDIVPKIIRENNKNFKDENTSFKVLDITSDELPKVDMIFCRDCLQHLSNKNIKKALKKFKDSGSKYLLVTNYLWTLENYDIENGDFRTLNLCQKPFNLNSSCIEKIKESDAHGNCTDKYLYLYKLDDIDVDQMSIKEKTPDSIPIAMALDENYVYPTMVSITSAMENSNYKIKYDYYIMHPSNLSDESKTTLKSLQEKYDNCSITLIDMEDKFKSAYTDSRISTPAYYRLMLSDLFPNLDKIIWVDGDTIVLKDLAEMFNVDMDGYCYKGFLDFSWYAETLKQFGVYNNHYICDGVMLANLKELRKYDAVKKFNDFISKNNDKLVQHDQTVINAVFVDKIGALPAKFGIWNQPGNFFEDFVKQYTSPEKYNLNELLNSLHNPTVLHCTYKPWTIPNSACQANLWWQYAKETGILDKIQQKYLISEGTYTIASAIDDNKVLDISDASDVQGAKIQLWDKNNTNAQKFKIKYDRDGYYTIEAVCSGKVIDVPDGSNNASTALWQYAANDTSAQKWYIISNKDGTYQIISKCNNMNIDVRMSNTESGNPIQCYPSNGTNAQKFKFIKSN